jgi:hypothetical protein
LISLHRRLLLTATAVLAVVFVLMAGVLNFAFDRAVRAHTYAELDDRIGGLVRVLRADTDGRLSLTRLPHDPRLDVVAGGLYWQIGTADGIALRSRSLGALDLAWPDIWPQIGSRRSTMMAGPEKQELLAMERAVAIETPAGHSEARIIVAIDNAELVEARQGFLVAIVPSLVSRSSSCSRSASGPFSGSDWRPSTSFRQRSQVSARAPIRRFPARFPRRCSHLSTKRMPSSPPGPRIWSTPGRAPGISRMRSRRLSP